MIKGMKEWEKIKRWKGGLFWADPDEKDNEEEGNESDFNRFEEQHLVKVIYISR